MNVPGTEAGRAGIGPRIGLAGFFLEANRFAPVTTAAHFAASLDVAGAALLAELRAATPRLLPDTQGFAAAMDAAGVWTPVPLRMALTYPGGPVEQPWFEAFVDDVRARTVAAGALDGVFVCLHGAALATAEDDPDARFLEALRQAVGPRVPIVAVLDLHTNVSARMCAALSGFVAYRTNPHVDLRERGVQAAGLMRTMLSEGAGEVVLEKLPFLPASTDQLIAPGTPYHALVEAAQGRVDGARGGPVLDVSLCGGFPLADCARCGFSVVVTARAGQRERAARVAREVAAEVWARRHDFLTALTPLDAAVAAAVATGRQPDAPRLILADVADNPGGGGGGNTVALLRALRGAGACGVLLGLFCDAALAQEAGRHGVGSRFAAQFNRGQAEDDPFAPPLLCSARVLALGDGRFVGRKGLLRGVAQAMGPSALLDLGGVQVAVISQRQQLLDPAQLEALRVDLAPVRTLVVKSRGHFRAAFDDFAPPERILEVDGPGLTSPRLASLPLRRLPRPIFPLDDGVVWPPARE